MLGAQSVLSSWELPLMVAVPAQVSRPRGAGPGDESVGSEQRACCFGELKGREMEEMLKCLE